MSSETAVHIPIISFDNVPVDNVMSIGDDVFLRTHLSPSDCLPAQFKVRENMVYYIRKGSVYGKTNGVNTFYTAPVMVIMQPDDVYSFYRASDDIDGTLILYSTEFSERLNIMYHYRLSVALRDQMALTIDDEAKQCMQDYYNQLVRIASYKENPFRTEAALHLTRAFFYGIGSYYYNVRKTQNLTTRSREVADEFLDMVGKHGSRERKMDFYADKLHLSPKYISVVVLKETYHPVTYWLEQATLHEAQRLLLETSLTIQQISNQLNFTDQAYFGAYFKRLTNMSPKQFRQVRS